MSLRPLHLEPPFHAEHVGSLLRPQELLDKRALFSEGNCKLEDLSALEDDAIRSVVKMQHELGLKTITDGEFRRAAFFDGVFDIMEGMQVMPERPMDEFVDYIPYLAWMKRAGARTFKSVYCTGKIKRTKPFFVEQFNFTKSLVVPEEIKNVKVNIISPSWFHQGHGSKLTYDLTVYKNDDEYFDDVGVAYRAEFDELYANGCRHIQIDDPTFCFFCNDETIDGMKKADVDPDVLLETYIRAVNVCTQGRPADLTIALHMCRGNFKGNHFCDGGYNRIAEKVFNELDVDTFYLEYDDERAGDFEPLKHMPPNKSVVLGLVTTKKGMLESPDNLQSRVEEAARAITSGGHQTFEGAMNQLCISPQCGFASTWHGNPLTQEDQSNKLRLVVDTTKEIWKE